MVNTQPLKVLHLITGLNTGGAEMALYRLLRSMDGQLFKSTVVSMIEPGQVGNLIGQLGIPVDSLEMPPGSATPGGFLRLLKLIRKFQPDILQTWMYHADFLGLLAGSLSGVPALAWNIRGSEQNFMNSGNITRLIVRFCALNSGWPQTVIVNSQAGLNSHKELGYRPREWQFIPNGIDTNEFAPDPKAADKVRAEWQIQPGSEVVGMVARINAQKGHEFFLEAARIILNTKPDVHFVCVGEGPKEDTEALQKLAAEMGLGERVHWPGNRTDMPAVYNAFNIYVSPSAYGEGFPNVIAEAMASGVVCIATRTGDAPDLIGDTGVIIPPRDSQALAKGILQILDLPKNVRDDMKKNSRQRIMSNFSMQRMTQAYSQVYQRIAHRSG